MENVEWMLRFSTHMRVPHILSDELFLRVIEAEVDRTASLSVQERNRAVRSVSDRLQAAFQKMLMVGTLKLEIVTVRISEEVARTIGDAGVA